MATVLEVINTYKPGQGGIDEGGFKVITSTPDYLYVQFESGKRGYVDDFEIALVGDGKVLGAQCTQFACFTSTKVQILTQQAH
jgi:hypothetical protein